MSRQEAVSELDEAHLKQAKTTLYDLAVNVRSAHPEASMVCLSESDQGAWMVIDYVVTPAGKEYGYDDPDSNDSCLYTDVGVLRYDLFPQYDVRGWIDYSPRMGLTSFHLNVAKVLADLVPVEEKRGVTFTRDQVEAWVGHTLTDDQVEQIEDAMPNSSMPDAFEAVAHEALDIPWATDEKEMRS